MKKYKVEFFVKEYPSFEGCVNWKWIKREALRDIFEPYGKVSKVIVKEHNEIKGDWRDDKTPIEWANHLQKAIEEAKQDGWNEAIEEAVKVAGKNIKKYPDYSGAGDIPLEIKELKKG